MESLQWWLLNYYFFINTTENSIDVTGLLFFLRLNVFFCLPMFCHRLLGAFVTDSFRLILVCPSASYYVA